MPDETTLTWTCPACGSWLEMTGDAGTVGLLYAGLLAGHDAAHALLEEFRPPEGRFLPWN